MSEDALDDFLTLASNSLKSPRHLKDTDLFSKSGTNSDLPGCSNIIHTGDTDSSDDEDNKYLEESNYNEYGRGIKHLLKTAETSEKNTLQRDVTWKSKNQLGVKPPPAPKKQDVYTDPVFGLRIVNPLVSFTTLQEKMMGRESVTFSNIKKFVCGNVSEKNWVLAGIIVSKSPVKTSQKGSQFMIWTLSDLKFDIKTVGVFLFGSAYKQLWKTPVGTVVGLLNSSILDKKDGSKDEATLSVDNAQKVLILGQSKDLGKCKSVKKNGEPCTAIVNINQCEFCVYHIKQEYQKCSKRSELQANFAGRGLTALRNKVLGKNEVFYGGKIYAAIPAKRSRKLEERDGNLLQALSGRGPVGVAKKNSKKQNGAKSAANIEVTHRQRLRDLTLLEKLGGSGVKTTFTASHSAEATLETSKKLVSDVLTKLRENPSKTEVTTLNLAETQKEKSDNSVKANTKKVTSGNHLAVMDFPLLSGSEKGVIDLDVKVTSKQANRAKLNALKYIQRNGPLKKTDPNSVKKPEPKKRTLEAIENLENPPKKPKVQNEFLSDRFKKIMEATSKHSDLLEVHDNEEQEKYFHKLETKEKMEEKMVNTFKVPCKAVRCLQCKYTSFSAAQSCKDNKHPLKVFDAVKRFFKCGNCGNRTQVLEVVPTTACGNCGGGKWERTGMMKEKTVGVGPGLSIRGGEQKFANSVVCRKFNEFGSRMLSRGFIQLEKKHAAIYKRVKSLLPRRESERRVHPLSRHCDILQAVETRISMLNMTYMKYIESNLLCFIPGKVLDEMKNVLSFVESDCTPPRTHQLLQELRDLSSMAMEHFDEHILPRVKEHKEQMDEKRQTFIASFSGSPINIKQSKPFIVQQVNDLQKIRKQYKTYKHQIAYLNQNTQKLIQKMKKQNKRLKVQSVKIREQERKIQEQSVKIQEQESALADIKKHMDEWDQKYKDLTTELVRARDYILLKTTSLSKSSFKNLPHSPSSPKLFKSSIKPPVSRFMLKSYGLDLERKRKSNLLPEIPVKVSRNHEENDDSIDQLLPIKDPDKVSDDGKGNFSFLFENLIKTPLTGIKSRKRKMAEEIDLK